MKVFFIKLAETSVSFCHIDLTGGPVMSEILLDC
jgi:hypothetical protein